jgi:ABC-type multidrug transport system ATPase subunit
METRERGTAAPASGNGAELDWRELGRRVRRMRQAELLRGLPRELLATMAPLLRRANARAGELIYREGEPATRFFIVESGRVSRIHAADGAAGSEELGPGASCGDAVLWAGAAYRATARAETDTVLWEVRARDLQELRRESEPLDSALRGLRPGLEAPAELQRGRGVRVDARRLSTRVAGDRQVLHDVSVTIEPGQLVAIVGGSGAGKSTLLDALAGVRPADEGTVLYDGRDPNLELSAWRSSLGYVPQDDIIHTELAVESTLRYAAMLRLPAAATNADRERAVTETLDALDLSERADVRVDALSGGQRKRVSIGVELLTGPRLFFLDEPTSGLDPATSADLLRLLRRLADSGRTVVLTTHAMQDIDICDEVIVLARDGHLAFAGPAEQAREHFQVATAEEIYERLAAEATPAEWARRFTPPQPAAASAGPATAEPPRADRIGAFRQWAVLTRRNAELLVRNRLTLAILLGSPLLVVAMFVILFQPGAFEFADPSPNAMIMIIYWVAFGGFFFGLTYGLLQICTEFPILRRERLIGLRVGPYVLSKAAVLMPVLMGVSVLMLGVLWLFDRLPDAGVTTYAALLLTLVLDAAAALALGLLTSAAVAGPAQATIALPLLCFPQVLFSGAILPVPIMASAGEVISYGMADRWAFEGMGHELDVERVLGEGGSNLGPPLLAQYGDTFSSALWVDWLILGGMSAVFLVAACVVCARK